MIVSNHNTHPASWKSPKTAPSKLTFTALGGGGCHWFGLEWLWPASLGLLCWTQPIESRPICIFCEPGCLSPYTRVCFCVAISPRQPWRSSRALWSQHERYWPGPTWCPSWDISTLTLQKELPKRSGYIHSPTQHELHAIAKESKTTVFLASSNQNQSYITNI